MLGQLFVNCGRGIFTVRMPFYAVPIAQATSPKHRTVTVKHIFFACIQF